MNIYFLKYNENEKDFIPLLSEQRKKAVDGITNVNVKREKIYSYILLRYVLSKEYGITEAAEFSYGERGKPFLKSTPLIHFNISHAGGCTACVVSDKAVGLDIQDNRPLKADISRKICTEAELEMLKKADDVNYELCRLWCIKESVGKLSGMGFAEGFNGIDTVQLIKNNKTFADFKDNFFISLSAYEPLGEIKIINADENQIKAHFL